LNETIKTFIAFGLLDERDEFVNGWSKDTHFERRSAESTMQILEALYKVCPGVVIIDDYGSCPP
jgi:hypothetical protein